MADILSQEEIDALLGAMEPDDLGDEPADGPEKRRIKEYDFKRPDKFSKDQVRTFYMVMESFARSWSTVLAGKLRSLVYLEIISIDQLPYEEFIRSMFTPSVIGVFSLQPLKGNGILDVSPQVAFNLIERMVGGTGGATHHVRELTEIEEALIESVLTDALRIFKDAMAELIETTPRLEAVEYNPQFVQVIPPSEMVLFVSLEMRIEDNRGMIGLCLPYLLLEPILEDLSTESFFRRSQEEETDEISPGLIRNVLNKTELELIVEIGKAELTVKEVLDLTPGDIVTLPTRIHDIFKVYVGDDPKPRMLARPGIMGRYKGIEIHGFCEE